LLLALEENWRWLLALALEENWRWLLGGRRYLLPLEGRRRILIIRKIECL
jgi:hypothetical protein